MPTVAYRAVRSRRKFVEAPKIRDALAAALDDEVKPHFIRRFEFVVANWRHKPEFKARKFIRGDRIYIQVYPAGPNKEIYQYVTKGTRAHTIVAKNAPLLVFQLGYKPKTKPPGKIGGPGIATGPVVRAKKVRHPGTEARNFEKVIAEDEKGWYSRTMENAWRRALRAA